MDGSRPFSESGSELDASGELSAAERLLTDRELDVALARPHLNTAWDVAHRRAGGDGSIRAYMEEQIRARLGVAEVGPRLQAVPWLLDPDNTSPVPDRAVLLDHVRLLRELVRPSIVAPRLPAWVPIGFVISVGIAMVVAVVFSVFRGPTGPWRGEWYDNEEFDGDPVVQYARKLEFDWGKSSPDVRGLGRDHWSVRFQSCLVLDEDATVRFKVSSDDGTRVWVGDEQVVDNWGAHATRTRTGRIQLEAGVHPIRVEYFEAAHSANMKVLAAFESGDDYESIPVDMLNRPDKKGRCE